MPLVYQHYRCPLLHGMGINPGYPLERGDPEGQSFRFDGSTPVVQLSAFYHASRRAVQQFSDRVEEFLPSKRKVPEGFYGTPSSGASSAVDLLPRYNKRSSKS
jgi:hypothetical protein